MSLEVLAEEEDSRRRGGSMEKDKEEEMGLMNDKEEKMRKEGALFCSVQCRSGRRH